MDVDTEGSAEAAALGLMKMAGTNSSGGTQKKNTPSNGGGGKDKENSSNLNLSIDESAKLLSGLKISSKSSNNNNNNGGGAVPPAGVLQPVPNATTLAKQQEDAVLLAKKRQEEEALVQKKREADERAKRDASQKELDAIFEENDKSKWDGVAPFHKPKGLKSSVELFDYQQDGVRWLLHQETVRGRIPPFYKQITNSRGETVFKCTLTGKHHADRPESPAGSILADGTFEI